MTRAETLVSEYLAEASGSFRLALARMAESYAMTLAWQEQVERRAAEKLGFTPPSPPAANPPCATPR